MSQFPNSTVIVDHVVENPDSLSISNQISNLIGNSGTVANISNGLNSTDSNSNTTLTNTNLHCISPLEYFHSNKSSTNQDDNKNVNVLLILNQKINLLPNLFKRIWENAALKICADGGLNRLRTYNQENPTFNYIPDFVIGDLDSVTNENLQYYQSLGTKKILQSSQYYTDFIKAISLINVYFNAPNIISNLDKLDDLDELEILEATIDSSNLKFQNIKIIVVGGVGGRFDQTMATINQIWNFSISRPHIHFIILNPEHTELIMLLKPGINIIKYPKLSNTEEKALFGVLPEKSRPGLRNVGILPLLHHAIISTVGLKWDVTNWNTSITTKMSSSNLQVANEGFIIQTDKHLFIDFEL